MKAPIAAVVLGVVLALSGATAAAQNADWDSGVSHYNQKQYRQAIVDFQKVAEATPDFANTYYYLGMSHFMLKEYSKAISDLDRYIVMTERASKTPEATARTALGRAYFLTDDFAKAATVLARAVDLDATKSANFYYLGASYERLKQPDKAVEALSRGIKLNPNAPEKADMLQMLTHLLLQKALASKAPADFQAAIQRGEQLRLARDDANAATLLGAAYLGAGDYLKASVHYAKVSAAKPDDGLTWYNYGLSLSRSNQLQKAETVLSKASELLPNVAAVWAELGYVEESLKRYDKALLAYEKAYQIQPDAGVKDAIDRVKPTQ